MKKRWIVPGLLVAAFALAATGLADPGHGKGKGQGHGKDHAKSQGKGHGKGKGQTMKFGPYDVVTDDHGSCGNTWAVDTDEAHVQGAGKNQGRQLHSLTRTGPGDVRDARPARARAPARRRGTHGSTVRGRRQGSLPRLSFAARSRAAPSTRTRPARPTAGSPTSGSRPSSARAPRSRASGTRPTASSTSSTSAQAPGPEVPPLVRQGQGRRDVPEGAFPRRHRQHVAPLALPVRRRARHAAGPSR